MHDLCDDLLAECEELAELCATLDAPAWASATAFYGWTPWDEVAHLLFFDEAALQSLHEPAAFALHAQALNAAMQAGVQISALARERYRHLGAPELLAAWRERGRSLAAALRALDPKARLGWYGPTMSARSFASARLMEVWAHGQDIWDLLGRRRPATPRLQHIAHIGATTFRWTFVNRGWPVPEPEPGVDLAGPAGQRWIWGEASPRDFVRGSAEEFCLVVTQRRHVDDTALECRGEAARQWMKWAQCFAGEPADPPPRGSRIGP
ncbi:MAG: hypothetical protein AMXMBFR66_14880 [Pseudomonadota bacterium]|nr:TIGR03084 family protein [Rubrivivax sp.]NLZ41866.1 TIGR03084 family protein [Comamonadaceae bacterium]